MGNKSITVNGFLLQNRIREQTTLRDVLQKQFDDSQTKFPNEDKPDPDSVMTQLLQAERRVAELQVFQTMYNMFVKVDVDGEVSTLLYAVKLIGSMGRAEKSWRQAATGKTDKYGGYGNEERTANSVYAVRVMNSQDATDRSKAAGRRAAKCREAIAIGNATKMIVEVDPELADLFD
jgi:hypothetical protein